MFSANGQARFFYAIFFLIFSLHFSDERAITDEAQHGGTEVSAVLDGIKEEVKQVVKLEVVPQASGVEGHFLETGHEESYSQKTVLAVPQHSSLFSIQVVGDDDHEETTGFARVFLMILGIVLVIAVLLFLAYAIYLFLMSGRERGWWPFRYYLRQTPAPDYAAISGEPQALSHAESSTSLDIPATENKGIHQHGASN